MQKTDEDRVLRVDAVQMEAAAQYLMHQMAPDVRWRKLDNRVKAHYYQLVAQMLNKLGFENVVVFSNASVGDAFIDRGSDDTTNTRKTPHRRSQTP